MRELFWESLGWRCDYRSDRKNPIIWDQHMWKCPRKGWFQTCSKAEATPSIRIKAKVFMFINSKKTNRLTRAESHVVFLSFKKSWQQNGNLKQAMTSQVLIYNTPGENNQKKRFKPRYNSAPHRPTSPLPILWSRVLQETWNPRAGHLKPPDGSFQNGIPSDREVHHHIGFQGEVGKVQGTSTIFSWNPNKKRNKNSGNVQDIQSQHANDSSGASLPLKPYLPISPALPKWSSKSHTWGFSNWISP